MTDSRHEKERGEEEEASLEEHFFKVIVRERNFNWDKYCLRRRAVANPGKLQWFSSTT